MSENDNLPQQPQMGGSRGEIVSADSQRAIEEVQASMIIAQRFPRNESFALDRILNACTRKSLAEVSTYTYARGGTNIEGPSIRLAEEIARHWKNLKYGIRELEQRKGQGGITESVVEAFAWDMENNTQREMRFTVKHVRHTRQGTTILTDPRDIYELMANQGARRVRQCILAVVPGDVVDEAVSQCMATLASEEHTTPEKIKTMVDWFQSEWNVSRGQIEEFIQRKVDAITPAQMTRLKSIANSLKDGMGKPEDYFPPTGETQPEGDSDTPDEKPKSRSESLKESLKPQSEPPAEEEQEGLFPDEQEGAESAEGESEPEPEVTDDGEKGVGPEEQGYTRDQLVEMHAKTLQKMCEEVDLDPATGQGSHEKNVDLYFNWQMEQMAGASVQKQVDAVLRKLDEVLQTHDEALFDVVQSEANAVMASADDQQAAKIHNALQHVRQHLEAESTDD